MAKFKEGDKVEVNGGYTVFEGFVGVIKRVINESDDAYTVDLENDKLSERGFFGYELGFYEDPTRKALIELAETLDKARQQANAVDEYAIQSQRGVYGQIALSLHDTLEVIIGAGKDDIRYATADRVYDSILDGNTVREALKAVKG